MPSWTELLRNLESQPNESQKTWLIESFIVSLRSISQLRNDRNVLFYSSAFLQKPTTPQILLQITHEEINGFMSVVHGMTCSKGLTLILHTPGGVTNATETIVSYLRSKFSDIEVVVPTFAMSAGTMISLAADKIIMGRQSQLGPIDPQMPAGGRIVSAIAILDQFERAKKEISEDREQAHLWAPILPSLGPALLQEAQNAIDYSEQIVADWLEKYMFKNHKDPKKKALAVAKHFSRGSEDEHRKKSHGRRIDSNEAKSQKLNIEDLESSQGLQDAVLTAYHLMTILCEKSPAVKVLASQEGKWWIKNGPG
ncbi:MAG: ATP-dependent Clp protease proteolytic subunit [Saprospiraceae bacterium]